MGSAPKIAEALTKHYRVVVVAGGSSTRTETRSERLSVRFLKEWLIPDPVNNGPIPLFMLRFNAIIAQERPVAVINLKHMFLPNLGVLVARARGIPVITATDTFPGIIWWSASRFVNVVLWFYARSLGLLVLKLSNRVTLFHSALLPTARRLGLRALVLPNGVSVRDVDAARPTLLPGGSSAVRVLYAGRLESVKGYETIFAAFKTAVERDARVHCFHVGYDENMEEFKRTYTHPRIHFLGRKDLKGVYSVMKSCDIVVLASISEGLPNVLMEGMAAGCVPISTPVGAVPELLEHGKNGLLFQHGDARALADAIHTLVKNPRRRAELAKRCRMHIERNYDWDVLADKYHSLIEDVRSH
jgi:glycosyltransferase involved in cell wall biosynthesis